MSDLVMDMKIKVLKFFKGDLDKAVLWFETENPNLGNVSPNLMIRIGREEKLNKFIDSCLEENLR